MREEKNFEAPPQPPKEADFGRTKAKIGHFSQKGLCYSFEILQGLQSNKNIRFPIKKKIRGAPQPPTKADFRWTKAEMGCFLQKGLCCSFEILQRLLSNKDAPQPPPPKAEFGRTKAIIGCFSQRGLCYSFGILHGLLSNTIIRNPMKKITGGSPLHPQLTLL